MPEVFAKLCWSFHAPPPSGRFRGGGEKPVEVVDPTVKVCGENVHTIFWENVTLGFSYYCIEYVYI